MNNTKRERDTKRKREDCENLRTHREREKGGSREREKE